MPIIPSPYKRKEISIPSEGSYPCIYCQISIRFGEAYICLFCSKRMCVSCETGHQCGYCAGCDKRVADGSATLNSIFDVLCKKCGGTKYDAG